MRWRRPIILAFPVTVAVLALLAAGCGGGGSPEVASVASSSATPPQRSSGGGASLGGAPGGQSGGGGHAGGFIMNLGNADQGAKLSACIRKHGYPTFPDPNGQGLIAAVGVDRRSAGFVSALSACRTLLPSDFGRGPTPAQQAQQRQAALALAKCMRSHGIKDFPDPTNGGLPPGGAAGSDLDPSDPRLQRAEAACRSLLPPAGKGIPGVSSGRAGAGG
jgi:hypothetical protein